MCGICGYAGFDADGLLEAMTSVLVHRGPDDEGYLREPGVGLGHRRLSIIDVEGGHQPIENEDGSLAVVANGEIYDFEGLREELVRRGHRFRTRSDSEVVLHLYEEHGPRFLERLNGMFAIALWDRNERRLLLARDRLGIKPLYWARVGSKLVFASEAKALLRWDGLVPTLDPDAVDDYLALRYVPGPGGLLREVRKLPAGHFALFSLEKGELVLEPYWRPRLETRPIEADDGQLLEDFAERFERSVRRRLVSEVPVGAYLSGGLDSSTIVAAIARETSHAVRTFTVGFDYEHDELDQAARTARALGCEHTEVHCRAEDVGLLPRIVWHLDEPVGDPIVVPMYQLAREARTAVTVILTGEGADEVFGGYLFHEVLVRAWRFARWKGPLRALLAATPSRLLDLAFRYPAALGRRGKEKLVDFVGLLDPERLPEAYLHLISLFDRRDTDALYTPEFRERLRGGSRLPEAWRDQDAGAPLLNRVLDLQFAHWLPDDILTKQDKTSMASSVEGRVPFLDHELVELGLRLPPRAKLRGRTGKWIVRRYAERLLPPEVTRGPKMPFYNPLERYAGEPVFRDMVDDTLSERSVRERGLFRPEAVARLRDSLAGGEFVHAKQVFSLVALELWFRTFLDLRGEAPVG